MLCRHPYVLNAGWLISTSTNRNFSEAIIWTSVTRALRLRPDGRGNSLKWRSEITGKLQLLYKSFKMSNGGNSLVFHQPCRHNFDSALKVMNENTTSKGVVKLYDMEIKELVLLECNNELRKLQFNFNREKPAEDSTPLDCSVVLHTTWLLSCCLEKYPL